MLLNSVGEKKKEDPTAGEKGGKINSASTQKWEKQGGGEKSRVERSRCGALDLVVLSWSVEAAGEGEMEGRRREFLTRERAVFSHSPYN